VTPGIYRHYKGNDYLVLTVARHSETEEALVIYVPLAPKGGKQLTPWARPLAMFNEEVEVEGKRVPRFKLLQLRVVGAPPR
jgi:hypothetical protein